MPPKNSGGSTKFPRGRKVIHRTAQTALLELSPPVLLNSFNAVFRRETSTAVQVKSQKDSRQVLVSLPFVDRNTILPMAVNTTN